MADTHNRHSSSTQQTLAYKMYPNLSETWKWCLRHNNACDAEMQLPD